MHRRERKGKIVWMFRKLTPEEVRQRFESRFLRGRADECWNWNAAKNMHGYGVIRFGGRNWLAHRYSYKLYVGDIPLGQLVLHACDNPACVNPKHLHLGTHRENTHEMIVRGRVARNTAPIGERSYRAKHTDKQIRAFWVDVSSGMKLSKAARKHGVAYAVAAQISSGRAWRHITGMPKKYSPCSLTVQLAASVTSSPNPAALAPASGAGGVSVGPSRTG